MERYRVSEESAPPYAAITLDEAIRGPEDDVTELVKLVTSQGALLKRLRPAKGETAILWVFGSGGGLSSPPDGLYTRMAERLQTKGVTSLELDYRHPGEFMRCVLDVLVGLAWLESLGKCRVVLVGHSFGGAVVINAGALFESVVAVAALSSQTAGTEAVACLSPRPSIFIYGEADDILLPICARGLYARAREPRELVL